MGTPKREVAIYTPGELSKLLGKLDPWWRPIPLFASETGLRWGELMGLRTDDFTLGMKTVTVRRTIIETTSGRTGNGTPFLVKEYPKSRRSLVLGLSPAGREAIINLIAARKLGPGDRLFSMPALRTGVDGKVKCNDPKRSQVWPTGVPIGRSYFRERIWLRAIERSKVPVRRLLEPGQYRAIRYTQRLADAAAVASVGSRGDSYDNALAEAFNSLFKAELIRNKGPWRSINDVEIAAAEYIDWFNYRRLHGEIGLVPPAEFETQHYSDNPVIEMAGTN